MTTDYEQVLGRQPDAGGASKVVALAEAGYDPAAVRAATVYDFSEAAGVVTVFYAAELGRQPDGPGLSQCVAALAAGESLDDVDGSPFLIGAISTDRSGAVDSYLHPAAQTRPFTVIS